MSIAAGERNRKISIMKLSGAVDDANEPLDDWVLHKRRWSRPLGNTGMAAIRGSEQGIPAAPGRYSWRCNFHEDTTEDMRVHYQGRVMVIKEVRHDLKDHEWTDLVCEYLAGQS